MRPGARHTERERPCLLSPQGHDGTDIQSHALGAEARDCPESEDRQAGVQRDPGQLRPHSTPCAKGKVRGRGGGTEERREEEGCGLAVKRLPNVWHPYFCPQNRQSDSVTTLKSLCLHKNNPPVIREASRELHV